MIVAALLASVTAPGAPAVGLIADDLIDYTTWARPFAALWTGAEVARILEGEGLKPTLLTAGDLTLDRLRAFDIVWIAGDHTYPERGAWGGPVAKALVDYVRAGGVYVMPIGIPHYIAKDITTGKLDAGHWTDPFGWQGSAIAGRTPLSLSVQGRSIGLPDPANVAAPPIRALSYGTSAALVYGAGRVPCLSAVPVGAGWVIHWGGGENMDQAVRDFLVVAEARAARAILEGRVRALSRLEVLLEADKLGNSLDEVSGAAAGPWGFRAVVETTEVAPGSAVEFSIVAWDTEGALAEPAKLLVRGFDATLTQYVAFAFPVGGSRVPAHDAGTVKVACPRESGEPFLVVGDLTLADGRTRRVAYWFNARGEWQGALPRTTLAIEAVDGGARVRNIGDRAAVAVRVLVNDQPAGPLLWLDPGESVPVDPVAAQPIRTLRTEAWNADAVEG
jgi:hypothetical protein